MKMEVSNWIKEGEWLCAIEGLAIAEKVYDFYFEEYDSIPQDKKIGDYNFSMVQYRLFCDYYNPQNEMFPFMKTIRYHQ